MNMRFTEDARKIYQLAFAYAVPNTTFVGPPHLLMALLNEGTCIASDILRNEHLDRTTLVELLSDYNLKAQSKVEEHTDLSEPTIDPNLINIVRLAWSESAALRNDYISTEHLLLAIENAERLGITKILQQCDINGNNLRRAILHRLESA